MEEGGFACSYDRRRRVLRVTLRGLWTATLLDGYMVAVRAELDRMERSGTCLRDVGVLIDRREQMMLPKELGPVLQAFISGTLLRCGRLAVVVASPLAKMQAARLSASHAVTFSDPDEAAAWLGSPTPGRPAGVDAAGST